jgi:hypothetical protein
MTKTDRSMRRTPSNRGVDFDTSALAKWYLNESFSGDVERYLMEHGPVAISDLTVVEMRTLLARRRSRKPHFNASRCSVADAGCDASGHLVHPDRI